MRFLFNKNIIFLLLLATSLIACLLSLVVIDRGYLIYLYKQFGFYLLFFSVGYWLYSMLPDKAQGINVLTFRWKIHGLILLSVLIIGSIFLVSPVQFRILADETNLVSVSYSMFMGQNFANVTESLYFYEQHHPLTSTMDIRPNFYPFLIFLVHVVTGYSPYNGFVVNFLAGVASLGLMFWLLSGWFRWQVALLGMLMLAAFPVFVLWVTSSGFEIVNLAMALLSFCLLREYLIKRDNRNLERLLLTLLLLCQTRYESVVFVLAIGIVLAISFRMQHLSVLSKRLIIIPWLFLPVAWHRLMKTDKSDYQVYVDDQLFSLDNFLDNLVPAYEYFSGSELWYGTIEWIFYLGIAGFLLAVVKILSHRNGMEVTSEFLFLAASVSFLGLIFVVFSYYWGNLTHPFTLRLGIIFIPFLVFSACYLIEEILDRVGGEILSVGATRVIILAGVSLILLYWPVAARNEAVEKLTLNRLYQNTLGFLQREFPDHNNLIITDRPGMYTVHQWGAVSVNYANKKYENILRGLDRRLYQNVIAIQEVHYKSGESDDATALPEQFELETLYETQFDALKVLRISRVLPPTSSPEEAKRSPGRE